MTRAELTQRIKDKAIEIGFTKAGVTSSEPFNEAAAKFEAWVASGAHGVMKWMERDHEKRRDVRNILPGAKSILTLALNYYHPDKMPDSGELKFSRYAWGTDYHEIIPPMLRALLAEIKQLAPEAEGRYYTDTGPLLEKPIAERAGVGWQGKHTNIITRELGSWVFLAEIILTIDLEPDPSAEDLCGTCTRCLDACPTGAFVEPYVLDARRCISYLTIEYRGPIPDEFHAPMGDWLFGCDICQEVCPWNRKAPVSTEPAFQPQPDLQSLDAGDLLTLTEDEFRQRFGHTALARPGHAGLLRNAAIVAGNAVSRDLR